ncbi:polysaccharide deacetylase family protein [Paenibacillus sp. OV219]|uniref:polysaccharide deacetylase family protein n=1 Tax=Paenibacillus sp. OV219 TaxID=1884377 RepID=UPI0015A723ED|nr:polysaccharide deacetylase family protein [Paenibacillus sp. OV219]
MIVVTLMIGALTTGCGNEAHSIKHASIIDVNMPLKQGDAKAKTNTELTPGQSQTSDVVTADVGVKTGGGIALVTATPAKPSSNQEKPEATPAKRKAETDADKDAAAKKPSTSVSGSASQAGAAAGSVKHTGTASTQNKPVQTKPVQPILLQKPTEPAVNYIQKQGAKLVALTFDDGPDSHFTPAILSILKASKVHGTFFTVGIQVNRYGTMMKRIKADGNEIGNHSYSHKDLSKLDRNQILSQIKQADGLINKQTGYVPRIVRAPYGAVSPLVRTIMKENHRDLIGWSVDTRDWAGSSVAMMRANVNKNTHPGGIILMHSFGSKLDNTVQLLPLIIKDLKNKGYTFVTVSELLAAKASHKAKK